MSADFRPTPTPKNGLTPFRYWVQRVLPVVYDDSLSYQELLGKVVDYLNHTIQDVNAVITDVDNLNAAYGQLEDYVNEYFENLDLQEQIDNKLDEMALDGSLSALISPFIPSLVAAWLNENVNPVGSAVVVDSSLSIAGAAADAAAVGTFKNEAVTLREPVTAATDIDDLNVGLYYKDSGIVVENGVNDRHARIIVFKGTDYSVVQLWVDTDNNLVYYRTKNTPSAAWSDWLNLINNRYLSYEITAKTEPGNVEGTSSFTETSGYLSNGGTNINFSRSEMMYEIINNEDTNYIRLSISMPDDQYNQLDQLIGYFYNAAGDLIVRRSYTKTPTLDFTNPRLITITNNPNIKYFKLVTHQAVNSPHWESITIKCNKPIVERYNLNKNNLAVGGDSLSFVYMIDDSTRRTSGRLILPPDYTVDGKKVPLIVYVHGSGSIPTWGSYMANSDRKRELFQYLANEGFAVFDCYPWTNEYLFDDEGNNAVYSPYKFPVIIESYLKGIEYVCTRFNVDINKVSMIAKSQGGHVGHWALMQNRFKFNCVCLQAPDITTGRSNAFYNKNARSGFIYWMKPEGTETEKNNFINNGNMRDSSNTSFIEKNKNIFVSIQPFAQGVTNSDEDTLYNDFIGYDSTSIPVWMQSKGFPAAVPYANCTVPEFAKHADYVKNSFVPVKFWCAFDDEAVSGYGNYAIYQWLKNGATDVTFRELPAGTGGHLSMDTSPLAITQNGTTQLGISYTNIPVAFVEAVEFIRRNIGD